MKKVKEFNFEGAKRGPKHNPAEMKVQKTIRLDMDIFIWLLKRADETRIPYQTAINSILKLAMDKDLAQKSIPDLGKTG